MSVVVHTAAESRARRRDPATLWALVLTLAMTVPACASDEKPAVPSTAITTTTRATTSSAGPEPVASSSTVAPTTVTSTTTSSPPTMTGDPLIVPSSSAPIIDGQMGDGEWADAATSTMSDRARVYFMSSDDVLYVAVAGDEVGAVNILLATADEVLILHSSAALGSARYIPDNDTWRLDHGFDWCCRNASDDSARIDLYTSEGWEANIGFTGEPGIVEYAIALPWSGASLVISSIRDESDQGFWPATLPEESRGRLLGSPPSERSYDIAAWPRLAAGD